MKKIFTILAAAVAMSFAANAQEAVNSVEETVESTGKIQLAGAKSNWFIGVDGGMSLYYGEHDRELKFTKHVAPAYDIYFGKWFTPAIGVRFAFSGAYAKGANMPSDHPENPHSYVVGKMDESFLRSHYSDGAQWLHEYQKFNYIYGHADVMFNLANIFLGYNNKKDHIWNPSIFAGLGYVRMVTDLSEGAMLTEKGKQAAFPLVSLAGLHNEFRITPGFSLALDVQGNLLDERFDGQTGGRRGEAAFNATLGVVYNFAPRGWYAGQIITRTSNAASADYAALKAANDELRLALANANANATTRVDTVTIIKKVAVTPPNFITFEIGKSTLTQESRVNVGLYAETIKAADPDIVYTITGYCDKGTGSVELNEKLSAARAETVYNTLINEFGISPKQLRTDHKGGVDNMFYDDPRLSRAVITIAE